MHYARDSAVLVACLATAGVSKLPSSHSLSRSAATLLHKTVWLHFNTLIPPLLLLLPTAGSFCAGPTLPRFGGGVGDRGGGCQVIRALDHHHHLE